MIGGPGLSVRIGTRAGLLARLARVEVLASLDREINWTRPQKPCGGHMACDTSSYTVRGVQRDFSYGSWTFQPGNFDEVAAPSIRARTDQHHLGSGHQVKFQRTTAYGLPNSISCYNHLSAYIARC